ncbi:MAG: shikimate dehydrogenase [Firmicutes bacterium]|nr:shikimate dehydrogenase [Bacillota bacterium]
MSGHFAFLLHPLDVSDVARKFPFLERHVPGHWLEAVMPYAPPIYTSHITGIRSPHNTAEGHFISVPLTPRLMLGLPEKVVLRKLIAAGRMAERLGARILGLGAFTAVVGNAGRDLADALDIAVTTGNSYTAATGVEALGLAADAMGIRLEEAEAAVVGATGSVGRVSAMLLARRVRNLTLVGRDPQKLEALAEELLRETGVAARISTDLHASLVRADVAITVSSAIDAIVHPEDLKPGAVVCDIARPRDVSRLVAEKRDDVLVIEGGIVEVPGDVDFHFNFGLPERMCLACMAETMMLALEERYEDYTLGRDYSLEKVEETIALARKHGFRVAGLRSFERALSEEEVARIRANAMRRKAALAAAAGS